MYTMLPFNKIIKALIISDLAIASSMGLIAPLLAIFVIQSIEGGTVQVVGFAIAIFWITKAILQIPVGSYLDRHRGEKDDYWFLVFGTFFSAVVPLFFIIINQPWQLYLLQALFAVGLAVSVPPWGALYARHIDKGREAKTWSIDSSAYSIGTGIAGASAGLIVATMGFNALFIAVFILGMVSTMILLTIKDTVLLQTDQVSNVKNFYSSSKIRNK